jgi:hypothetical protein
MPRRSHPWSRSLGFVVCLAAQVAMEAGAELPPPEWVRARPMATGLEAVPAEAALAELSATEGLAFLLLTSDTCRSCPAALAWLAKVGGPVEELGPIYAVEIRDVPESFRHEYGLRGTPNVVIFRGGRPVDLVPVASPSPVRWLYHLVRRLDPSRTEPFYLSDLRRVARELRAWGPEIRAGLTHLAHDWGDVPATGLDLRASVFSGLGLRGADFSGSDFSGSVFAGCDLEGARFEGATLDDVVWLSVLCPDGTPSESAGGSCLEHLSVGDEPR